MAKTTKEICTEIFLKHIDMATKDGKIFRRLVMEEMKVVLPCSQSAAATNYNNCKKAYGPIEGLGRAPLPKGARRMGKGNSQDTDIPDNDCFTVIELIPIGDDNFSVGRCQSFIMQGDASELFDLRIQTFPNNRWIMIQGLGPNHGDYYKLAAEETEIKRYPAKLIIKEKNGESIVIEDDELFEEEFEL